MYLTLLARHRLSSGVGRSCFMNPNTYEIIQILDKIIGKLSKPDCNVLWSHYDSQVEALTDIKDHIERLKKNDFSKIEDLKLLFAPTGSLQEISISSGWGNEFLVLATQFDKVNKGET
jgi:hypothetical protein